MNRLNYTAYKSFGFSLVEIIVAISLFAIFVAAVLSIVNYSYRQIIHASNIQQASIISDESLEILKNIRDNNFSNLVNGIHGLSPDSGQWRLTDSPDTFSIFVRSIEISDFNDGQKLIEVSIEWGDEVSSSNIFEAQTYLTDWRGIVEPVE